MPTATLSRLPTRPYSVPSKVDKKRCVTLFINCTHCLRPSQLLLPFFNDSPTSYILIIFIRDPIILLRKGGYHTLHCAFYQSMFPLCTGEIRLRMLRLADVITSFYFRLSEVVFEVY